MRFLDDSVRTRDFIYVKDIVGGVPNYTGSAVYFSLLWAPTRTQGVLVQPKTA